MAHGRKAVGFWGALRNRRGDTYRQKHEQRLLLTYGQQRCARVARPGCSRRERSLCLGTLLQSIASQHLATSQLNRYQTYSADEVGHRCAPSWITTLQEPSHTCRICNALNSKTACTSNFAGELVEEQWANGCGVANVALLPGSAGVNYADGTAGGAIGKLVVGAATVLALGEGVLLGRKRRCQEFSDWKCFRICGGCWDCEDAGEKGEREECELHIGQRM